MTVLNKKAFWERVNYSTDLDFGKKVIEKVFSDEEIKNKTVLDLGCGTGGYSLAFRQKGARSVTGVDFSASSINTANRKLEKDRARNVHFLNADVRKYDFREAPFDIIWCHGVIYYMPDPYEVLNKMCNLVSREGKIFVSFMKNTYYSKIMNAVRKTLWRIPKNLWGAISFLISAAFFPILFIFNNEKSFSRIRTKVLAQFFPILNYCGIEEAEKFFSKNGFKIEKIMDSIDVFSYTTEFGVKAKSLDGRSVA